MHTEKTHQQKVSPLFYLPPTMWTMGTVGYLGCHAIKYFVFPAAIATPLGFAAGAMVACPVAAALAFVAGYGADTLNRNYGKPALYGTFIVTCPIVAYNLSMALSTAVVLTTGFIALAAVAASVALFLLLKKEWEPTVEISRTGNV